MAHLERVYDREVRRLVLAIVFVAGIAIFTLFLIFGVVAGLSYLVGILFG